MSKIDELLKNEKVEWKKLGEVCEIKTGQAISKTKIEKNKGIYPVINSGKDPLGYINIWNTEDDPIGITSRGAGVGSITYQLGKYYRGNLNYSVTIKDKEILRVRFLYHLLNNLQTDIHKLCSFNGIPALNASELKTLKIPIPSLETQEKIVKILDKFTNYVTELQAKLQTELHARNKQYEYYRDMLLSEEYLNKLSMKFEFTNFQVKCQNLEDITYITSGGDIPKESYSNVRTGKFNIPIISNGVGENAIYGFTDKAKINEDAVTISARGTIGYAQYRNYPFYPIVRLLSLVVKDKSNVNTKYLYYLMQDKKYNLPPTGIPQLTIPMLKKIKVILPLIEIQNKVVEILDKFQSLLADTKGLLPEEIEKRQKQYEYYREKLLTFQGECDSKPQAASRKPQAAI